MEPTLTITVDEANRMLGWFARLPRRYSDTDNLALADKLFAFIEGESCDSP